jgi:hypothetical protein
MNDCTCTIGTPINSECKVHGLKDDMEVLGESYKTDFSVLSVMGNTLLKQGEKIIQLEKENDKLKTENKHLNELLEMYIPTFRVKLVTQ